MSEIDFQNLNLFIWRINQNEENSQNYDITLEAGDNVMNTSSKSKIKAEVIENPSYAKEDNCDD